MQTFRLHNLELPWKLLITLFLIVLSSGFLVSELYLMHTTEMADGKEGLSLDDITFTFHGDETKTGIKKQITGPMKKYMSETQEPDKLTKDEQADLEKILKWNDAGAKEEGYWNPKERDKDKNKESVYNLLSAHGCFDCHSADATMKGNKKDSPLDTFAGISKFTKPDTGMDKGRLLMLSHVHLLGMGMMFLLVGAAVASTAWPVWMRCMLVVGGLSSILFDIFGWWAVKYGGAMFSPVVMFGGGLMGVSFGLSVLASLYDLWLRDPNYRGPVLTNHAKAVPVPAAGE